MELTENKVKNLLNEQVINQVNDNIFDQILEIAVSHACGKPNSTGTKFTKNTFFLVQKISAY